MATNPYLYSQYPGPGVGFGPGPDIVPRTQAQTPTPVASQYTAPAATPAAATPVAAAQPGPGSPFAATTKTGIVSPGTVYNGPPPGGAIQPPTTVGSAGVGATGGGTTPGTPGTPGAITQQQQLMAALSQGPGSTPGTGTSGLPPAITPGTGTPTNAPGTAVASSYQDPNQKKPFGTPGSPIRFF